jgi:hypothetical protein
MSRANKVNRDRYTQRGRLTPDEAARELAKQRESVSSGRTGSGDKAVPKKPAGSQKDQ